MIEIILMLFGLAFSNNNTNTTTVNDNTPTTVTANSIEDPDTGGETGQLPPPPKK
ncbi:hypothetical protein [Chryseobacterium flavum]|uniref:hypothetical protein n=1 Tax=Chryseobacterium flavum TaxID=415851 RepID=UPI0028B0A1BE|nr:hypothetical protein [Chryseobacterium flavum]